MADGSATPAKRPPIRHDEPNAADLAVALVIAFVLHLALLPLVALVPTTRLVAQEPESAVNVEIVGPPASASPPVPRSPQAQAVAPQPPLSQQPQAGTGPVTATHMLSGQLLSLPKSRKALAALNHTAPGDRAIQLCNIEAMAQIHTWKGSMDPDYVVAYALWPIHMIGDTLEARGAAVRDARHWLALTYRCGLMPDRRSVARFEFTLGEPIPQDRWSELNLPADDGEID